MVKITSSLLALTLVTGSALAFSNEYERRSELEDRDLDVEELFQREYDLEAREPGFSSLLHHLHTAGQVQDTASSIQNRGFEDDENILGRAYDLEAREPPRFGKAFGAPKEGHRLAVKHHDGHRSLHNRGFEDDENIFERAYDLEAREPRRLGKAFDAAKKSQNLAVKYHAGDRLSQTADAADSVSRIKSDFQNREFVDDEEVFGRDLDAEELFGREYDLFDDLD